MTRQPFTLGELVSLTVAIVLHTALFLTLWLYQDKPETVPKVERVSVSLAEDVGLDAAAPDLVADSRASIAPNLSDNAMPAPEFEAAPPIPATRPVATNTPRPHPTATATRKPNPRPTPTASRSPRPHPTPTRTSSASQSGGRNGGSRLGENFLEGAGSSATTAETRIPASQIGRSARASIVQAITRQIRPHWSAPSGVDAERLVSILAFELNENGSLKGRPRVVSQSGETASNRAQKRLHAERAIRAVQLAAPFDLPAEYYNAWKSVRGAKFDRNLAL